MSNDSKTEAFSPDGIPDSTYYPRYTAWARDPRYLRMKRKYGHEGAGILAELMDYLREQDQYRATVESIPDIAYLLQAQENTVQAIVAEFGLFTTDDGYFYSPQLCAALWPLDEKRRKATEAGAKGNQRRWGKPADENGKTPPDANPIATPSPPDANPIASIVEYSKGEKSKEEESREQDRGKAPPAPPNWKKFSKENFQIEVDNYHAEFARDMLDKFFDYWTEPNPKGVMRFQLERTWDTKRRLKTWEDRQIAYNTKGKLNGHARKTATDSDYQHF
jgi:hypothetical protein